MLEKKIADILAAYVDPYTGKSWQETQTVAKVLLNGQMLELHLTFPYPNQQFVLSEALRAHIMELAPNLTIQLIIHSHIAAHAGNKGIRSVPGIKNIVLVGSGKGGVGKSLIAQHLAVALQLAGARVGLLDADVYGPSQPHLLGVTNIKPAIVDHCFVPIDCSGIQAMSMGFLVPENTAMVWRGPMLGKALQQMLEQTKWDKVDYLIVDLPPGTGDIQLTLCQKMPISGAVIVTTPQNIALLDVRRACEMFSKLQIPILGIIENMSGLVCDHCGHLQYPFSQGGGQQLAKDWQLPFLGQVPLDITLRDQTDSARARDWQITGHKQAQMIRDIALKTAAALSCLRQDYSHKFPKIVVK